MATSAMLIHTPSGNRNAESVNNTHGYLRTATSAVAVDTS